MSEATDWIGAVGGAIGAVSVLWSWATSGKAKAAADEAAAAKTAADDAKITAGNATADATKAIAKAEDAQTKAQVGWLELQLRVFISSRRDKIHEVAPVLDNIRAGRRPDELTAEEKARFVAAYKVFESAHEDFLGALEQACRHYRDAKIDTEAFRLMYDDEVRFVCEQKDGVFFKFMHPKDTSKFRAVWAVYKEWFDLESKRKSA